MLPQSPRARPGAANLILQSAFCLAALAFFCFFQPADWLICPFRRLTGLPCPLCGMTHALCAIGHGQVRDALELHSASPLIFATFVGGFLDGLARLCGWLPSRAASWQPRIFSVLLVVLLGFWAWRMVFLMV